MQGGNREPFRVGDWQVEPGLNLISRDGSAISLRPRVIDLLVYLSARAGEVVSVDEIIKKVWGGVIVTDGAIYNCVNELRHAFGDSKDAPEYIETISKRGYRLIAPVLFADGGEAARATGSRTGLRVGRRTRILASLLAATLAGAIFLFVQSRQLPAIPDPQASARSIAVLPFKDLSPDSDQEYFGDGIAEEIVNALIKIEGLRVTSRTSSFAFKNQPEQLSLTEIGTALNVEYVLEGSVRTAGNTIRVTAQLIEVSTDSYLWAETFDRDLDDVFAIQDEISHAIVDALQVTFGTEDKTMVAAATSNMEAYDIYLQGKFEFARRGRDTQAILNAVRLFEEATNLDPGFANAFAGLGRARAMLINWNVTTNATDRIKQARLARAATDRALMLDADNAEAFLSSAIIRFQFEADFEGAEADFGRAVSLSPNVPEIYNFYGDFLNMLMEFDRAILIERRAAELDPLSIINAVEYGRTHVLAGHIDEGLGILESLVAAKPDEPFPARMLGWQYYRVGRIDDSLSQLEQAAERWPANRDIEDRLLELRAINGDVGALQELMGSDYAEKRIIFMANVFFELGDFDQAAIWLDRAYQGSLNYYDLIFVPIADPRRQVDHPGLNEILSRPGIEELMDIRRRNLGLDTE